MTLNTDLSTFFHGLTGVDDNVLDHLAYLPPVHLDTLEVLGKIIGTGDIGTTQDKSGGLRPGVEQYVGCKGCN